jgi:hypothetical protein
VTLELRLTVDATVGGATVTGLSVLRPGTLTVPIGPDVSDTSLRIANLVFDVHMRDLKPSAKGRDLQMPPCPKYTGLPQGADSLGLGQWAKTIAYAAGRPDHAALHEAAYDVEFTLGRGLHGGVTFKSVAVEIDAGKGAFKKTNDNHLNVVFQSDPPATKDKTGKTKASPSVSRQLDQQRSRFLPQQLILQNQRGLTVQ